MIELDNNATTAPSPGVIDAMVLAMRETWHNPSSVHRAGQDARRRVELARASIARLIGAKPAGRDIIFTSGGTEALDLAIRGLLAGKGMLATGGAQQRPVLVTSKVEHAAVRELAQHLEASGTADVRWLPLLPNGRLDVGQASAIVPNSVVVVQWANNETGVIQPVRELGELCKERGATFVVDATQWVGKMPTNVTSEPFDAVAFAPHKFHGPKGVGVLWMRPGLRMRPQLIGTQELGRRGGTENVPAIVGAGLAADEALEWVSDSSHRDHIEALRDRFEQGVLARIPDARVNGPTDPALRLWNTTNIGFPGLEAEALLLLLSERGVAASAGAACSSGSLDPSPVLLAMGVSEPYAHGSLRFSLSKHTTPHDVERAVDVVAESVARLRQSWHSA